MTEVAVVTGANSGIGRATAITLAKQGMRVLGTVRSLDKAEKLNAMAKQAGASVELVVMDVASDDSVKRGFEEILARAGRVDHLVNNAGVGGNAVAEECTVALYHDVMNVNLYGAVRCIHAVLPQMRARRSGTIVNVSSVVGKIAAMGQQPYFTSKWALEGMSEGLAQEVAPFGIRVSIVEPGLTKSAIFAKNVDGPNKTDAYDAHYRRLFQFYAAGIANATDPFEVGAVVHRAITTREPQLRYAVSWGSREMIEGRARMSDQEWIALGAHESDTAYYDAFEKHFGVRIHP